MQFCFHSIVDVSAQSGCTITPINPTTLTAAGGVLAIGTENVTIQCNCTDDDGRVIPYLRWYNPNGTKLQLNTHYRYVVGTPYYRRELERNFVLIIPTFSDSNNGIYTCGIKVKEYPPGVPNATISLNGEL